jgi:oxygen-independent coproporphyrinogen-3 oxidase
MAGIYIHIPFCKQKCHYCDFHFSTTFDAYYQRMVESICLEIEERASYLEGAEVKTLYFGGGSPSLLDLNAILKIKKTVVEHLNCSIEEFTFECNPDDLTDAYLDDLINAGVNRLSIGIQSFDDDVLQFMNRAHNADEALNCVERAQQKGITNISIDLIYGVPNTSGSYWKETVKKALSLDVKHISAYCLTIEAGTVFSSWKKKDKLVSLPEEEELAQFNLLNEELSKAGIHRYEVSNFGKSGFESMHNSAYWSQVPYLGIGPSAHSFNKIGRQWNVSHNRKYMDGVFNNDAYFESEVLEKSDMFNECLLTGLRTVKGVSMSQLDPGLRTSEWSNKLDKLIKDEVLSLVDGCFSINEAHLFRADGIASDLFVD